MPDPTTDLPGAYWVAGPGGDTELKATNLNAREVRIATGPVPGVTLAGTAAGTNQLWDATGITGRRVQATDGTTGSPVTGAGPALKVSRTGAVTRATIETTGSAGTDGSDQLAAIMGISKSAVSEGVQGVGVAGFASTDSTAGTPGSSVGADACGVYGVGRANSTSVGAVGIGAFFQGRRDSTDSLLTGVEVAAANFTATDGTLATTTSSSTKGIWIHALGNADVGAGIQFGNPFGRQFKTGLHFNAQVNNAKTGPTVDEDIRSDSSATTGIHIAGTHTHAIRVAAGAGPVRIGITSAIFASDLLEVYKNGGADPMVCYSGQNTTDPLTVMIRNGAGDAKWFTTGAAGDFLTGTAQGDSGIAFTATKTFHFGRYATTPPLKVGNGIGFYGTAPQTKQTVTGSRGANAALASLLTALATVGLITDSST